MLPFLAALAPFAPLIGGVVSGLGALLAPKPEPQTETVVTNNSIDLKKLRADADAAGFNPLTIIRGGGLAGYGSQQTTSTMSAAPDMRLSNAFQAFGSGIANFSYDPYAERRFGLESRLMEAQIADYGRRGVGGNMSLKTPKAVGSGGDDYTVFGINLKRSPWFTDAQEIENRHGDLAGSAYGVMSMPADAIFTGWKALEPWVLSTGDRVADAHRKNLLEITVHGGNK